ncbi:MAG: GDSL-type esterase/lipase family protein [Verrucomicrobiota bacterium]
MNNGSGSGNYATGSMVTVTANTPASGYQFAGWTGATGALADPSSATTTLTMPSSPTSITATYSLSGSTVYLPATTTAPNGVFSLTKIISAYSGPAITVVRSTDSASLDIGFLGQTLDTTAATNFAGGGTLTVSKVYDQSGNGNHLTQTTAAFRPKLFMTAGSAPVIMVRQSEYLNIPATLSANRQNFSSFMAARFPTNLRPTPVFDLGNGTTYDFGWFTTYDNYLQQGVTNADTKSNGTARTLPSGSPCIVGVVSNSSGLTFHRDNFTATASAVSSATMSNGGKLMAAHAAYVDGRCDMFSWVFYPAALVSTDSTAVKTALQTLHNTNANTLSAHIFIQGDSITEGVGSTNNITIARALSDSIGDSSKMVRCFGKSGDEMLYDYGTWSGLGSAYLEPGASNILVIWLGTNDIALGQTASQLWANYATYISQARAVGWTNIIGVTALPRADLTSAKETERQTFNALVRANAAGYFNAIWDADALTASGQPLDGYVTSTYLSPDHLHPSEAAYILMAPSLKAVVSAFYPQTTGVTAVRANDFLNSIGVCTHIAQGIDDPTVVTNCLLYTGIRNIRENTTDNQSRYINIHNATGAKFCLLPYGDWVISHTITRLEELAAAGALLAAEGPNEPNNWPVTYNGVTSGYATTSLPIAQFQRDLYSAVKADSNLAGIPVFHSSEAGGSEPDNVGLQYLTIPSGAGALLPDGTKFADYANPHNYVCGNLSSVVDNNAWKSMDPILNSYWDGMYVEYGRTWHAGFNGYTNTQLQALPKVCTETGWVTQGNNAITEDQQGKLLLNLYLAAYKQGWKHVFVYMLRDDPGQGYWGFYRTDNTPKASATYLHNMTAILADTGSVTPSALNYSIPGQPATVHDLLIQKSNGNFELAVWNERASGSDTVTVNLGGTRVVSQYDPTIGTTAANLGSVSSVTITLSDHPVILEIH